MAVIRTLDRIRDGLQVVFETRSAPDDQIEFDASLGVVMVHAEDDEEDAVCASRTVVYIWLSMLCPEITPDARSTCQVIVPVHLLDEPEEISQIGNSLWDSLQSHRTLSLLDAEAGGLGGLGDPPATA